RVAIEDVRREVRERGRVEPSPRDVGEVAGTGGVVRGFGRALEDRHRLLEASGKGLFGDRRARGSEDRARCVAGRAVRGSVGERVDVVLEEAGEDAQPLLAGPAIRLEARPAAVSAVHASSEWSMRGFHGTKTAMKTPVPLAQVTLGRVK